jgi:hypothetical protein
LELIVTEGADHAVDHTKKGYLDDVNRRQRCGTDPGDARERQSRR